MKTRIDELPQQFQDYIENDVIEAYPSSHDSNVWIITRILVFKENIYIPESSVSNYTEFLEDWLIKKSCDLECGEVNSSNSQVIFRPEIKFDLFTQKATISCKAIVDKKKDL